MQEKYFARIEAQVFPPVQFFTKYFLFDGLIIDANERFEKQSYRNRFRILGSNKVMDLVIPVQKGKTLKNTGQVEIVYAENWRHQHLESLRSAYGKSPFFNHYFPQVEALYANDESLLFNWALNSIKWAEIALGIQSKSLLTFPNSQFVDLRNTMHPKPKLNLEDSRFKQRPYFQCFSHAGFVENLSILDLIFNEGPNALVLIEQSLRLPS